LAEAEYMRTAENRDNARLIDRLSSGAVSEIAVVQAPSLGLKKVKPKRSILLVLAAMLAFGFGIVQALVRGLLGPPHSADLDANRVPPTRRRNDPGHGRYRGSDSVRGFSKPPETEPALETEDNGGLTTIPR
jgi:hypothetical protein